MRAAGEFSEAVQDPKRWHEWLGGPPSGLPFETWVDLGLRLGFGAVRAARGKKHDTSYPPNPLRWVEAPPDRHGGLLVRELETGKFIWGHEFSWPNKMTYAMTRVAISGDGRVVALGDLDLSVWSVAEDRPLVRVTEGKERVGAIKDVAVSPDGRAVAVARNAGGLELWHTRNAVRFRLVRGQVFEALTWTGPYALVAAANTRVRWIEVGGDLGG